MFLEYAKNDAVIKMAESTGEVDKYLERLESRKSVIERCIDEIKSLTSKELTTQSKLRILDLEQELSIIYLTYRICNLNEVYDAMHSELFTQLINEDNAKKESAKKKVSDTELKFIERLKNGTTGTTWSFANSNFKIKKLKNGLYNLYAGRKKVCDTVQAKTVYNTIIGD